MNILTNIEKAKSGVYYTPDSVQSWLDTIGEYTLTRKNKGRRYKNLIAAFDTETTSFTTLSGIDVGTMYVWMLAVDGSVMLGRTYEELSAVVKALVQFLKITTEERLLVYVHNLSFDWQFVRKHFAIADSFCRDTHDPLYVCTTEGLEFRCTLNLSNSSLEKLAEDLIVIKAKKLVGNLSYRLKRHYSTPLTEKEIHYCIYDVIVVSAYIYDKLTAESGNINKIPYTQTGYVRRLCRSNCLQYNDQKAYFKYRSLMKRLTLTEDEYNAAHEASAGGFTHADPLWVGATISDVTSMDFTSSYPAVMISETYPMGRGTKIDVHTVKSVDQLMEYTKKYACLIRVCIKGVEAITTQDYYLSKSKCICENVEECNGRVVSADSLMFACTDVDWDIITRVYKFKSIRLLSLYTYRRDYLPRDYIMTVLDLYVKKTMYKNVPGKEEEYARSKEQLNALFGMADTNIIRDCWTYDEEEYVKTTPDLSEALEEYNTDNKRFLSYLWGQWITAYARRNLWTAILELGRDYIYSDTDSVKFVNADKHKAYFGTYNRVVDQKIALMCKKYDIPRWMTRPKTKDGEEKPIGWWDFDGHYDMFKTLGAKRYMYVDKKGLHTTIAGVNKKKGKAYLERTYKTYDKIFEAFSDGLTFPAEYTYIDEDGKEHIDEGCGKKIYKYIDFEYEEDLTDYLGNTVKVHELSSVYLEPTQYSLGLSGAFKDFLYSIGNGFIPLRTK